MHRTESSRTQLVLVSYFDVFTTFLRAIIKVHLTFFKKKFKKIQDPGSNPGRMLGFPSRRDRLREAILAFGNPGIFGFQGFLMTLIKDTKLL